MTAAVAAARLLAGGAGVGLLALAYRARTGHDRSAADTFAGLLGIVGATALCTALFSHRMVAYKLLWLYGFLAIPLAFALFGFDYYGLDCPSARVPWWVAVVPLAVAALGGTLLVLGTPAMVPGTVAPVAALAGLPDAVFEVSVALRDIGVYYASGLMLVAVGLVLWTVLRYDHLDAGLGVTLSFVGVWPWVAYVVSPELTGVVGFGGGLLAIAGCYAASVAAAFLAASRYDVVGTMPAAGNAAPERVLDSLADPVVVTDGERVLRLNDAARRTFGVADAGAVGAPVGTVVGDDDPGEGPVELDTAAGRRRFERTVSVISDREGNEAGTAVVYRDVTRRETREQRLQVLNRVVRHNLRNDMNEVLGRADLIADGGEEHAARIKQTAQELVSLGERAREVEEMMSLAREPDAAAGVGPALEAVADDLRNQYPGVEITTAVGDGLRVDADPRVLRTVLRNAVENACEHNDADEPLVVASAERSGDGVGLAVADNGPGLSEQERGAVEAGTESQLTHGSGLGLWAINWGVRRMGGELSFAENDPRGTVLRLDLPAEQ
ncbi:MAG: sensor histidine kinase [Halobacteriaceae archaeon]